MKKIKKITILFLCILVSACTVDYDLTIKSQGQIKESATFSQDRNFYNQTKKELSVLINNEYDAIKQQFGYEKHNFSNKITKDIVTHNMNREYETVDQYFNESPFYDLFFGLNDINKTDNGTLYRVKKDMLRYETEYPYSIFLGLEQPVDIIEVSIRFHNKVVETNADFEDNFTNTYTWNINQNDLEKEITFELANSKRYDIIIIDYLTDYFLTYLPVFVIAGVVGISILYVYGYLKRQIRVRNQI